ncbi:MAG: hypothetical protein RLO01_12710 [Thalassobaculaceae bacterium]
MSEFNEKIDSFNAGIVYPTLDALALHRTDAQLRSAAQLLLGTAIHESGGLAHRYQIGGPALGLFQMEPATFWSLFENYLIYRRHLFAKVWRLFDKEHPANPAHQIADNDRLACAMARVRYFRTSHKLPAQDDLAGHAAMWKAVYNTRLGKGTEEKYIADVWHHAPWLYPGHVWEAFGA